MLGSVAGAIVAVVISPIFEDDSAMKGIVTSMLLAASLANIYVLRGLVLPAQMRIAGDADKPVDAREFQRAAQSVGTLAMAFMASKGVYAVAVSLFTGWPWVVIPFAVIALVEFGVYGSYLGQQLDCIWRDKIQLGSTS